MSKQVVIFFPGNSVWEARGAPLWRIPLQQHRRCQVLLHLLQVQGSQCLRAAQVFLMQLHELLLHLGRQLGACRLQLRSKGGNIPRRQAGMAADLHVTGRGAAA